MGGDASKSTKAGSRLHWVNSGCIPTCWATEKEVEIKPVGSALFQMSW